MTLYLCVATGEVDPSVETGSVMCLYYFSTIDLVSSNPAIVGTLRTWKPFLWPTVRMVVRVQKGELLSNTEPRLLVLTLLHDGVA